MAWNYQLLYAWSLFPRPPRQINQIVSLRVKLRGASIRKSVFVYGSFVLLIWTLSESLIYWSPYVKHVQSITKQLIQSKGKRLPATTCSFAVANKEYIQAVCLKISQIIIIIIVIHRNWMYLDFYIPVYK